MKQQKNRHEPVRKDKPTTDLQKSIRDYINQAFVPGTIKRTDPVGDRAVRITDWKGDTMTLTTDQHGNIINADTKRIYAFGVCSNNTSPQINEEDKK